MRREWPTTTYNDDDDDGGVRLNAEQHSRTQATQAQTDRQTDGRTSFVLTAADADEYTDCGQL